MIKPPLPAFAAAPVAGVGLVLAGLLTALSGRYGFHRDELYFLAAGDRPGWGYVDQPPLTPLIARAATTLFGESPAGLRVASTLAAVASAVVVSLLARELNASRIGQVIAACSAAASGLLLVLGHMVSTTTVDLLAWLVICWLVLRLLRTSDGRWWLAIGAAVGIAILNKYLVVLLLLALFVALLVTGPRRVLRTWWLPAGAAVAFVLALPNLWWQASNGWPQLTVAGGISADDGVENRIMFVPLQILQLSPLLVPVWVAGFVRLWRTPELRWARSMALAYPFLCALVLVLGGKAYYALPVAVVLMAAGGESVAAWLRRGRAAVRTSIAGVGLVAAVATSIVVALPVLPPQALAVVNAINKEQGEQVGWPSLVRAAAEGWSRIPEGQRDRSVVFTQNYGQAGAIELYGPDHGLPAPYSSHMSYADWGPPPDSADGPVLFVRQKDNRAAERFFTDCQQVATVDNGVGVENEEQNAAIVLCAGAVAPWSELWPDLRHFY
ncbi:ArnT family glycosyltransferase [Actinopolymorpha alba]|uniref:ArnT family glycosyltransferase n=1 Tax=Actinopolymorpha alba TaxID=533267 RepID=UPI0003738752|nr:glycosyltransferase family 39 protein [Actinopolymorpha alba]